MSHNPFTKPKPKAKRSRPRRVRGRTRLDRDGMEALRREVFTRSGGLCEAMVELSSFGGSIVAHCGAPITWGTMELSHRRHGPNKSDEASEVIASCQACHRAQHNAGGKPVPRKPGRQMNQTEAMKYWSDNECFCGHFKQPQTSFCIECLEKLDPQLSFDVQRATGEDYLKSMAVAEQALLVWRAE